MDLTNGPLKKAVVVLAIPVVLRMTLQMIVGMVDLALVGRLGREATAAVGLGNQIVMITISVVTAFTIGTTALIARFYGANDKKNAAAAARQSIILSFLSGAVLALLGVIFARQLILFMMSFSDNINYEIVDLATGYLRIVFFSLPFMFTMMNTNAILQGAGDMKTPLFIMIFVNLFNVVGDLVLIFGLGFFPAMGVNGAAMATGLSRTLAGIIGMVVLSKGKGLDVNPFKLDFDMTIIRDILKVGIPSAIEQMCRQSGTMLFTMFAAGLGDIAMAANPIIMKGMSMSFMPGFGFGLAATTIVGQNLGANKPERAKAGGYEATKMSLIFMSGVGLLFFFFSNYIAAFFTTDQEVRNVVAQCLKILAISQPFLAFVMVLAGALRGAGDTKYVLWITMAGTWGMRVVAAFVFSRFWGIYGLWYAMVLDNIVRAILMTLRFSGGKWQQIKVGKKMAA